MEHFDVVIVGAGVSGIDAAVHLRQRCPRKRYVILEARARMGGTWDLFRYPGIRSDSDLFTYGYGFKPWRGEKSLADGPSILGYLAETVAEYGIAAQIRYRHHVVRAEWSSETATWTVETRNDKGETVRFACNMLLMCAGYYSYRQGYTPELPGIERFAGRVVHPQQWPEDLDYRGRRVVVIGSGATAVTLVPAMAPDAAHVVMLQRSPSYILSWPAKDRVANALRKVLPERWGYALTRWKNIRLQLYLYRRSRTHPAALRRWLIDRVREALGPGYDVATHFTPRYGPWDQRLCLVPDGDLFTAIRSGRASVVTDRIAHFAERGIRLESGRVLEADLVVTATGLDLVPAGEIAFALDGRPLDFATTWTYKGMMYSDVPNLVSTFGYVNASWTLRADMIAEFACRLIERMDATGAAQVAPRLRDIDHDMPARPFFDALTSGYMKRVADRFPKQGRPPWEKVEDYAYERRTVGEGSLDDGILVFGGRVSAAPAAKAHAPEALVEMR